MAHIVGEQSRARPGDDVKTVDNSTAQAQQYGHHAWPRDKSLLGHVFFHLPVQPGARPSGKRACHQKAFSFLKVRAPSDAGNGPEWAAPTYTGLRTTNASRRGVDRPTRGKACMTVTSDSMHAERIYPSRALGLDCTEDGNQAEKAIHQDHPAVGMADRES